MKSFLVLFMFGVAFSPSGSAKQCDTRSPRQGLDSVAKLCAALSFEELEKAARFNYAAIESGGGGAYLKITQFKFLDDNSVQKGYVLRMTKKSENEYVVEMGGTNGYGFGVGPEVEKRTFKIVDGQYRWVAKDGVTTYPFEMTTTKVEEPIHKMSTDMNAGSPNDIVQGWYKKLNSEKSP